MARFLASLALAGALLAALASGAVAEEVRSYAIDRDSRGSEYVAGELLVSYEEAVAGAEAAGLNAKVRAKTVDTLGRIDARLLLVPAVKALRSRAARQQALERVRRRIERSPLVEAADYNYVGRIALVPNDPDLGAQWGLANVNAFAAWDDSVGTGTRIAILDSGIAAYHPEFTGALFQGHDFHNNDTNPEDNTGHGTHVAGIAAANTDNGVGVAGAAPLAGLGIYKVCETGMGGGTCPHSVQAAALDYIAANNAALGISAINMSIAGTGTTQVQFDAITAATNAGALVVAAAGNNATDVQHFPAAYPGTLSVGSLNRSNGLSNFSNFGPWVDVVAPGGTTAPDAQAADQIWAPVPGDCDGVAGDPYVPCYDFKSGTSMAAPLVTGIAALRAAQGSFSPAALRARIIDSATDLGPACPDNTFGNGAVNAAATVGAAPPVPSSCAPGGAPSPPAPAGNPAKAAALKKCKRKRGRARKRCIRRIRA